MLLINGVEILNYKSGDSINYGDIRSLEITSNGEGYDVINPPVLDIDDNYGSGAEGTVSVDGSLVGFNIIDRGFGCIEVSPKITISGGQPDVGKAEVNDENHPFSHIQLQSDCKES